MCQSQKTNPTDFCYKLLRTTLATLYHLGTYDPRCRCRNCKVYSHVPYQEEPVKPKAKTPTKSKLSLPKLLKLYELCREGLKMTPIASAMGVDVQTLKKWKANDPDVAYAWKAGRDAASKNKVGDAFLNYVHGRLPSDLQDLWRDINGIDVQDSNAEKRIERLLEGKGKRIRQSLFIHAMVATNFNRAEACRKVNLSYDAVTNWLRTDPEFARLMDMVTEMKKDFCESALMGLVSQGDTSAVIFTNKTLNRDRGYDPKVTVKHEGTVNHQLDIASLGLPAEVMRAILEAVRKKQESMKELEAPRVIQALPTKVFDEEF